MTKTPEGQAVLKLGVDVLGLLDTVSHLEDHGDKHKRLLRVPLAAPYPRKFVAEILEKRFADPPLRDEVAVGGKLHHPFSSALPDEIVRNFSQEMGPWVGVNVIPVEGAEQGVGGGELHLAGGGVVALAPKQGRQGPPLPCHQGAPRFCWGARGRARRQPPGAPQHQPQEERGS